MARYRAVHGQIWLDDKFPFLGDDEQLVWFHAYTTNFSSGLGAYHASLDMLAAQKRWPVKRYGKGFGNLCAKGLVRFDERAQMVWFPKFFDWNKPANPNVLTGLLGGFGEIPECGMKIELFQSLEGHCREWGKGFPKVAETLAQTLPQTYREPYPKQCQYQYQYQRQKEDAPPPGKQKPALSAERPVPNLDAWDAAWAIAREINRGGGSRSRCGQAKSLRLWRTHCADPGAAAACLECWQLEVGACNRDGGLKFQRGFQVFLASRCWEDAGTLDDLRAAAKAPVPGNGAKPAQPQAFGRSGAAIQKFSAEEKREWIELGREHGISRTGSESMQEFSARVYGAMNPSEGGGA